MQFSKTVTQNQRLAYDERWHDTSYMEVHIHEEL